LIKSWTDGTSGIVEMTLVRWMIDPIARWGAFSWVNTLQGHIQGILAENDKEQRETLYDEAYAALEDYENLESSSILELVLWKSKLKSVRSNDDTEWQAPDREECRFLSGSDVVIPCVVGWLGIL